MSRIGNSVLTGHLEVVPEPGVDDHPGEGDEHQGQSSEQGHSVAAGYLGSILVYKTQ